MLDKAPTTGADAILLDLEDAVPDEEKATAREMVRDCIPGLDGFPLFVRTSAASTGLARKDLEAAVLPGLNGVFIPKVDSPDDVRTIAGWLDELEVAAGIGHGTVELICMLESARGVRLGYEIAISSPRVVSLLFASGENGDFQTDMGCDWSVGGVEMLYARSKVVLDSRAAGLEYILDGVFVDIDNLDALVADTTLSKRLGYTGRTIIHPKHVEQVNRIYTPSDDEVDYYRELIATFENGLTQGKGAVTFRGKMIDYAMSARAHRVLERSEMISSIPK
jgi:citrate lyase subunit beta/citryl-CoA lyase